jgi:hypothetical protein
LRSFRLSTRALAFALLGVLAPACGLASHDAPVPEPEGSGGTRAGESEVTGGRADHSSGGANAGASSGGALTASGGNSGAIPVDASDCADRPLSDCAGVETLYGSNGRFDDTPAFKQCGMFNSYDGCGVLEYRFDAQGCATSVAPGMGGWKYSDHLSSLQACLTQALGSARYPCLASGTLRYEESCFIR